MEGFDFDWLGDDYPLNFETPKSVNFEDSQIPRACLAAAGPAVESASLAPERADQPSQIDKQGDKSNPERICYDFRWKVSQREKIRARSIREGTVPNLVMAPSEFWKNDFQSRLESILKDKCKFPGDAYTCEETIIDISIERTRRRGLTDRCKPCEIDWVLLDSHLESLGTLFRQGRKITFGMEFIYKEATGDSMTKGKKNKKNASEAQKAQRAADAGLWARVYEHYRCRGTHCSQGPHCWSDERGTHHRVVPAHLEDIVRDIKNHMKEGDKEEEVDITKIPPKVLKDILDVSGKRKAEADGPGCRNCKARVCDTDLGYPYVEGDRREKLVAYGVWSAEQVKSNGEWTERLQAGIAVALERFLDLNLMVQRPEVAVELMVQGGADTGIAWQIVTNIARFQQETKKP